MPVDGVVDSALVVQWQGQELRLYLDRPYTHYQRRPEQFDEIVTHFLNSLLGTAPTLGSFASICNFVFPLLKPMEYVEAVGQQIQNAHPGFATALCYQRWNGMGVCYVVDEPNSPTRMFITSDHLDRWKVDFSEVVEVAKVNLASASDVRVSPLDVPDVGRAYLVEPGDDYGATRILLPELLTMLADQCQDDLLMAIPTRDLLLAVPSRGPDARAWLEYGSIKKFRASPDKLTPQVFRYDRASGQVEVV